MNHKVVSRKTQDSTFTDILHLKYGYVLINASGVMHFMKYT